MNEVWKKPPVSFEAYQALVGKEIGVSSWHLIDQRRDAERRATSQRGQVAQLGHRAATDDS